MGLDTKFVKHLTAELNSNLDKSKIKKVYNISKNQFVFQTHDKKSIYISCNNEARINLTSKKFVFPSTPSNFTMYLRKFITNFQITSIEQINFDRIVRITLVGLNELKDITTYHLYIELFGRFSNIILCNENNIVMNALKLVNNENKTLLPNCKYEYPLSTNSEADTNEQVIPCYTSNDFYYKNIFSSEVTITASLSELLDTYFEEYDSRRRINNLSNSIFKKITTKLKSKKNKIQKLLKDLEANQNSEHLRIYGDLILTYGFSNIDKENLKCKDFDGNEISIPLNSMLSTSENANYYYTKYQKKKRSISIIQEQISKTKEEIYYLEEIIFQLGIANEKELVEITNEFKQIKFKNKKDKSIITKIDFKNATIYIGKNNIQNNEVTFNIARKDDLWFHIKDIPGSHVVVKNHENDNEVIEYAAKLAGYFSKGKNYPYVDIIYTTISNVKKISGSYLGHVKLINDTKHISVKLTEFNPKI